MMNCVCAEVALRVQSSAYIYVHSCRSRHRSYISTHSGTTVIVVAVFAAGSAVQTGITFYLDEAIMRELTEISRRSSENRRMELY